MVVPGDPDVDEPCSDLQTATLLLASPNAPSVPIGSTTFLGADETFSIDVGRLVDGAHYVVLIAERGPEGFPDLCREAQIDVPVIADEDDDGVADARRRVSSTCPVPWTATSRAVPWSSGGSRPTTTAAGLR